MRTHVSVRTFNATYTNHKVFALATSQVGALRAHCVRTAWAPRALRAVPTQ